jgi:hypothetical protein
MIQRMTDSIGHQALAVLVPGMWVTHSLRANLTGSRCEVCETVVERKYDKKRDRFTEWNATSKHDTKLITTVKDFPLGVRLPTP